MISTQIVTLTTIPCVVTKQKLKPKFISELLNYLLLKPRLLAFEQLPDAKQVAETSIVKTTA